MKTVGWLMLGGAFAVAAFLVLNPTHVSFLGTQGSCGIPIFTAFTDPSNADDFGLSEQCRQQSVVRFYEALGLMLTVGLVGLLLITLAPSGPTKEQQQFAQWQAWQMQQENARQWADYHQRMAEWERQNGPSQ